MGLFGSDEVISSNIHRRKVATMAANTTVKLTKDEYEEFKAEFKEIDKDNSGEIDVKEVEALLKIQLDRDPSEEEVTAMLNAFDKNQDGKVTFEEYMNTLCGEGWTVEGN